MASCMIRKNLIHVILLGLAGWSSLTNTVLAQDYYVYVAAESDDEVALLRFDGTNLEVVKTIEVGTRPNEIEGPHGLNVSADGEFWYLSIAHGFPYGKVVKYKTGSDELVQEVEVGLFPATIAISEATGFLYVVNFNLHGRMTEESSVSVIETETMTEIERIPQGIMPHGSRMSPDGLMHYSASMMTGELVEIDAITLEVVRRLETGSDPEGPNPKPTWVTPHPTKPLAFVANNAANQIAVVDLEKWEVVDYYETSKGPYNLDITPDGKLLIVSYKGAASTGVWDLEKGEELALIPNSRTVTHGVAVTPDGRYAFVSAEGVGGEPGAVDVIDLSTKELVASVDVGKQAGGIIFWKMTE